ncbi:DNA glycosylase AlkZ-like family protein [Streptomyces xanthophaeus]|uniref:DNA glycosylase AlkZ-like family protein n=1 Tax=Streptomyces xanthophaeus TaxID=67385 RepID=UPI000A57D9C8
MEEFRHVPAGRLLAGAERDRDLSERNPAAETAVEFMVWSGELASTRRAGGQRLFDLAERSIPAEFLNDGLTDDECLTRLPSHAGTVLGVATADDLADRITSVDASQWTERYAYDEVGNQTEASWPAAHPGPTPPRSLDPHQAAVAPAAPAPAGVFRTGTAPPSVRLEQRRSAVAMRVWIAPRP